MPHGHAVWDIVDCQALVQVDRSMVGSSLPHSGRNDQPTFTPLD